MLTAFLLLICAFGLFCMMGPIFASRAFARSHWKPRAYNWWCRTWKFLEDCTGGNRSALKPLRVQLNDGVMVVANMLGAGAAVLTPSDGDPKSLWWKAVTRQAQGKFTLRSVDPWLAIDYINANVGVATLTNYWVVNFGIPSQNTDNSWSVTMQFYMAAGGASPVLTDPILNDVVFLCVVYRNSILNP